MSMHDRATAAVLAQMMFAADGVLFGAGVAYVAYRSIRKYAAAASALRKIRGAPSVLPSDLRSILTDGDDSSSSDPESSSSNGGGRLVVVRGSMEVKSAAEKANWKALMGNGLVASKASGEKGVILQRTQTCIYNEWKGVFGWTADLRSTIAGSLKEQETSPTRMRWDHVVSAKHDTFAYRAKIEARCDPIIEETVKNNEELPQALDETMALVETNRAPPFLSIKP